MTKLPTIKTKSDYSIYRQRLVVYHGIYSYIDQFGKVFTACSECINPDCEKHEPGCMIGTPSQEIAEKIGLKIEKEKNNK